MGISSRLTSLATLPSSFSSSIAQPYCFSFKVEHFPLMPCLFNNASFSNFPCIRISPKKPQALIMKATSGKHDENIENETPPITKKPFSLIDTTIRLVRLQTLVIAILGFSSAFGKTLLENYFLLGASNWGALSIRALAIQSAVISATAYVVTVNQISDLEIDKINKPYLPLASGEIPVHVAWIAALGAAMHSIATAIYFKSNALLIFVLMEIALGSIYSLPPFCTKRNTYGAVVTCSAMSGFVYHLLMFAGAKAALGLPFQLSPSVMFIPCFATAMGLAGGVLKDLPDMEGDRINKVPTLAVIHGPKVALSIGAAFVCLAYGGAAATGFLFPQVFKQHIGVPLHLAMGSYFAYRAWDLKNKNFSKEASTSLYKLVLTALVLEYIVILIM